MTTPLDRVYEQLLVVRCQAGDEAAFAELVARHTDRLRRYVERLPSNDRAATEDVVRWCCGGVSGVRRVARSSA